jgi:hypothetical protein
MYEPSLEEAEAFGSVCIHDNDIYFKSINYLMVPEKREDFATKPYLQLLSAAGIAYQVPEFFGYNVPNYYEFGDRCVYLWIVNDNGKDLISIVSQRLIRKNYASSRIYRFDTVTDAKSFMFRLVLCWLKQESEK